ncbi:MAG: cache domain-containing protein [Thermodesulfobacteriota bacterium]
MPFSTTSRALEFAKIVFPAVFALLMVIATMFGLFLPQYRQSLLNGKKEMVRELVYSAWSMLDHIQHEEEAGGYSREEAQRLALTHLRGMRYGTPGLTGADGKDYFWVNDFTPSLLMHPYRPDLVGKDLTDFTDPDGVHLFMEFIDTVNRDGEGYVSYKWQWKDDAHRIVPKLSFVKVFKPWGWIVGTGIYLEDVRAETSRLTNRLIIAFALIFIGIFALTTLLVMRAMQAADRRRRVEAELREHQEQLENRVRRRTNELRQANESLRHEVGERENAERTVREQLVERERLIADLQKSLAEIRTLSGLLPICSYCKKIRDDSGYWKKLETYIQSHSHAQFSHGICPDCADTHFPEYDLYDRKNG